MPLRQWMCKYVCECECECVHVCVCVFCHACLLLSKGYQFSFGVVESKEAE